MRGSEALEPLLPDGTPEHFSLYGGLLLVAAIASARTGDPWRADPYGERDFGSE